MKEKFNFRIYCAAKEKIRKPIDIQVNFNDIVKPTGRIALKKRMEDR